ncbi:MAG TPA: SigE family RNA polymerase sigma factor [Tetrasphaera sp.]|uniref:SigE family RNA polymerase sigma factor n=1 Tax=Nostocoides sp. TaxID=1917966 RepID=UPI002C702AE5|nr:SigE family RNA polymerase sigma factor [Tetrasphaera sp.]HNQ08012.1 SigE family RNA polymerase sigma factor [Tetrasphaera sp.]
MARAQDFEDFVQSRYAALARTAVLLAGTRASGEDLLQEALIRTYLAWPKVRESAADAYVRTTMVRLLLRDRKRRWSGEIPHGELPETAVTSDLVTAPAIRAALQSLPTDQRAAIVLRFYAEQTEAQIADTLGCAPGTVKSRVSRGLDALRRSGLLLDDPQPATPGRTP